MACNRLKVPQLILVQPFSFALLMIDFDGPAVASDTRNAGRLPLQAVGDIEDGVVGEVGLAMIDDQALFAKVVDMVRVAVAVIVLRRPLYEI